MSLPNSDVLISYTVLFFQNHPDRSTCSYWISLIEPWGQSSVLSWDMVCMRPFNVPWSGSCRGGGREPVPMLGIPARCSLATNQVTRCRSIEDVWTCPSMASQIPVGMGRPIQIILEGWRRARNLRHQTLRDSPWLDTKLWHSHTMDSYTGGKTLLLHAWIRLNFKHRPVE